MNITSVKAGDIVQVDKKGRVFFAVVDATAPRELAIRPISPGATYYSAKSTEVKAHWRKAGR
jgi:hypothetical protein